MITALYETTLMSAMSAPDAPRAPALQLWMAAAAAAWDTGSGEPWLEASAHPSSGAASGPRSGCGTGAASPGAGSWAAGTRPAYAVIAKELPLASFVGVPGGVHMHVASLAANTIRNCGQLGITLGLVAHRR